MQRAGECLWWCMAPSTGSTAQLASSSLKWAQSMTFPGASDATPLCTRNDRRFPGAQGSRGTHMGRRSPRAGGAPYQVQDLSTFLPATEDPCPPTPASRPIFVGSTVASHASVWSSGHLTSSGDTGPYKYSWRLAQIWSSSRSRNSPPACLVPARLRLLPLLSHDLAQPETKWEQGHLLLAGEQGHLILCKGNGSLAATTNGPIMKG